MLTFLIGVVFSCLWRLLGHGAHVNAKCRLQPVHRGGAPHARDPGVRGPHGPQPVRRLHRGRRLCAHALRHRHRLQPGDRPLRAGRLGEARVPARHLPQPRHMHCRRGMLIFISTSIQLTNANSLNTTSTPIISIP